MKIYISADIEGVTGVDCWDEATIGKPGYNTGSVQLTNEVKAACEGANNAGGEEILVQDAHDTGRNIIMNELPHNVEILRGWSEDPRCMVQEIDKTYDALILIGQHSPGGSAGNPLVHTLSPKNHKIKINGLLASEYLIAHYTAEYYGVPLVFVSGDEYICSEVYKINPEIAVFPVKRGIGGSVINIHPQKSITGIRENVEKALKSDLKKYRITLPKKFEVEIENVSQSRAYRMSFYPGAKLSAPNSIIYKTKDFYEVLRMLRFTAYHS